MELALSLGDASKSFPNFLEKSQKGVPKELGFFMGLGLSRSHTVRHNPEGEEPEPEIASSDPPAVQLDLLPFSPVNRSRRLIPPSLSSIIRPPWITENNLMAESDSPDTGPAICGVDVNRPPAGSDEAALSSSPTSAVSSFPMDFSLICGERRKRDMLEIGGGVDYNDDDENGLTRKKLRLSKEQSAFLEESFKEHHTLNPKQKQALAKQLNLRARQVEVWFQNRRARTKLKQTEVDCEYLKRCCETLTEDNRRLHKEVQELRALKVPPQPRYIPATTLTMCPSCERVATSNNKPKILHQFCGESQKRTNLGEAAS